MINFSILYVQNNLFDEQDGSEDEEDEAEILFEETKDYCINTNSAYLFINCQTIIMLSIYFIKII